MMKQVSCNAQLARKWLCHFLSLYSFTVIAKNFSCNLLFIIQLDKSVQCIQSLRTYVARLRVTISLPLIFFSHELDFRLISRWRMRVQKFIR